MVKVTRFIPLLVYEDTPAAHDLLVEAFGFKPGDMGIESEPYQLVYDQLMER